MRSKVLPAPRFLYSPVVAAGGFAFVSGLVGLDPATGLLATGGAAAEARQVLSNLFQLAAEQGWSMRQLVLARVFCTNFEDFPAINAVWEEVFAGIEPPARTSLGVNALPLGARVEIEFQFVVGVQPPPEAAA